MNRYQQCFQQLAEKQEQAFIPFVVLGDPTFEDSLAIIDQLVASGADALELSIPFSDPLADGPEIQTAVLRAMDNGMSVARSFELLKIIRERHPHIPIGLLMYANLINAKGLSAFYQACKEAGVDSVLVADVPLREAKPFVTEARKYNIAPIFICPPDATDETIEGIAAQGEGYTYLVSRAGVTGVDQTLLSDATDNIARLKKAGAPPIIQGFGIATKAQAEHYLALGIEGVISGSAIVKLIRTHYQEAAHCSDLATLLPALAEFVTSLKSATKPA